MDSDKAFLVDATVEGTSTSKRTVLPEWLYCVTIIAFAFVFIVFYSLFVHASTGICARAHLGMNKECAALLANTTTSFLDPGTRAEGEQGLALQVVQAPQEGRPALHMRKKRSSLALSRKDRANKEGAVQREMRARALSTAFLYV